jgi:hypothetical protein
MSLKAKGIDARTTRGSAHRVFSVTKPVRSLVVLSGAILVGLIGLANIARAESSDSPASIGQGLWASQAGVPLPRSSPRRRPNGAARYHTAHHHSAAIRRATGPIIVAERMRPACPYGCAPATIPIMTIFGVGF